MTKHVSSNIRMYNNLFTLFYFEWETHEKGNKMKGKLFYLKREKAFYSRFFLQMKIFFLSLGTTYW